MSNSRSSTPPTHPTYGIHLSNGAIRSIIQCLLPECTFISAIPLEHGKSFNNRIYFIKVEVPANYDSRELKAGTVSELVLKVNGQFFGPSKVQNEVSCLTLLRNFLPEIPSPKVIAWSDTKGTIYSTLTPNGIPAKEESHYEDVPAETYKEWVLITKVPGAPVSDLKLSSSELEEIGRQLGDIVSPWRDNLPVFTTCGNLRCEEIPQAGKGLQVRGLHLSSASTMPQFGVDTLDVITTHFQYYKLKLEARLQQLQHREVFRRNAHLVRILREFIDTRLPQLEVCSGENEFFFTHYDLAPRNVLVSMNPLRITGIIDFEFAGFFPELDEFVNDAVSNKGAWPDALYQTYMERLEEKGIKTPRKGISSRSWEEAIALGQLEANIAPWWLENVTDSESANLEEDLSRARELVEEATQKLFNRSARNSISR